MIDFEQAFLVKAKESLAGAESEFLHRRFNNCANRAYYACFQAAIHALMHAGNRLPVGSGQWGHDFVQVQFVGQRIIRREVYSGLLRDTLIRAFALRRSADYGREAVGERQAQRALERASTLVTAVAARQGA